jgi:ABC-type phosphate/phosphonate transport system substrate-binding protein
VERRDYEPVRFDIDVGKHGDTGISELDVLKAVLSGQADAGAVGSPFWAGVVDQQIAPRGALVEVWTSPLFSHCMFTGRVGLEGSARRKFTDALFAMCFDNPAHRRVLEAEGLKRWVPATSKGYDALREAARIQGFFGSPRAD